MSLNLATRPKRIAFAKLLNALMEDGIGNNGEPWTNAGFARVIASSRENAEMAHVSANSVANWRKGRAIPFAISGILRGFYGPDRKSSAHEREALRKTFLEARAEKALEVASRAKPAPAHEAWEPGPDDRLVKALKLRSGDKKMAVDPLRRRMQQEVEKLANDLAVRSSELSTSEIWARLSHNAATLRDAASADLSDSSVLGAAYAASIVLGGLLETSFRIQRKVENIPQLPTDVLSILRSLVQITAPWLRGFPTVRSLDAAAGVRMYELASDRNSDHRTDELLDSAAAFAAKAGDAGLISKQDAGELRDLAEAATGGGSNSFLARARVIDGIRNLQVAATQVMARRLCGVWSPKQDPHRRLFRRVVASFIACRAEIKTFAHSAIMQSDLAAAMLAMAEDSVNLGDVEDTPLDVFQSRLLDVVTITDDLLDRLLSNKPLEGETVRPERLREAMRYAVLGGGKRFRSFLVIETALLFKVPTRQALMVGAALECLHAYSLVHDDLPALDGDDLRRGKPTVHLAFDDATALLSGDGLLTFAFDLLARPETHGDPAVRIELIGLLARAAGVGGLVGGQMLHLAACGRFGAGVPASLDRHAVRTIQAMRTGALLRFACLAGATLGGANELERNALDVYGRNIGEAFQIADDLLDMTGDEGVVQKATVSPPASIVAVIGLEAAKRHLTELIMDAISALRVFGGRAETLVAAAQSLAYRKD
jgi:farnesyl diphosphate synthase